MPSFATELVIVLLLNGAFSMSEMAIVSARKARLEQLANAGDKRARAALNLANEPNAFLSTVQVGITLVGVLTGAFGGTALAAALAPAIRPIPGVGGYADPIALGIVVIGIAYVTLILGELVPKRLALNSPETVARIIARPMNALATLATPFVALLGASTDLVLRLLGVRPADDAPISQEEVSILIAQGTQAGVFGEAEGEVVESAFRLNDRSVASLMTPRADVAWLDVDAPPDRIRAEVIGTGHSRFPVCRGGFDEVLGMVGATAVLAADRDGPLDLGALVRPTTFFPETVTAFRAIEEFKRSGSHLAVVIDEYGTPVGLISVFDILEALVGGIPSPEDVAEPPVVRRADGSWLLDGALPLEDVKDALGVPELPGEDSGEYRTLGGLAMHRLGRVPRAGDAFDWEGLRFEVVDMDGRRIDKMLVAPLSKAPPATTPSTD